jgi:putative Holliday junction resolvase
VHHNEKQRIMGLDVGDARIGVALSDVLGITSQPFCTVEAGKRSVQRILQLIIEQNVGTVVVGMPLELDGKAGPQAQKVQTFLAHLRSALERRRELQEVDVETWDERLSTVAAKRVLAGSGLRDSECHSALDRISAALILESYLNRQSAC